MTQLFHNNIFQRHLFVPLSLTLSPLHGARATHKILFIHRVVNQENLKNEKKEKKKQKKKEI